MELKYVLQLLLCDLYFEMMNNISQKHFSKSGGHTFFSKILRHHHNKYYEHRLPSFFPINVFIKHSQIKHCPNFSQGDTASTIHEGCRYNNNVNPYYSVYKRIQEQLRI